MKGKMVLAVVSLVALSACTSGQQTTNPTPAASPKASASAATGVTDAQWAAAFQKWGAVTTPPRNVMDYRRLFTFPPAQNLTGGKVSDADVKNWVEALGRSAALNEWADDNFETQFLTQGPLVAPGAADNVFGPDRKGILAQQAKGATSAHADPFGTVTAVGVVAVPQELKDAIKKNPAYDPNAPLGDFATLDKVQGPITTYIRVNGKDQVFSQVPAGQGGELVGSGNYKIDPVVGPIWVFTSVYPCQNFVELRDLCSQLR
ncbi:MAG: hypothetical protein ACYDGR_09880 [Candidatus Dormibacteria bacterium]